MSRALLAGLSGTLANQTLIDVLGNNIANANTVGFKGSRVTFEDAFYQTQRGGRAGAELGLGGLNPQQIGSGTNIAQVQTLHTQGSMQYSGAPLDAAIEGQGMFMLSEGDKTLYTRDGSFTLDNTMTLISGGTGMKVLGWGAVNGVVNTATATGPLSFPIGEVEPGTATGLVTMGGNLDAGLATGTVQSATESIYDALGEMHQVVLSYTKTAANTWQCSATVDGVAPGVGSTAMPVTLTFDPATGSLTAGSPIVINAVITSGASSPLNFDIALNQVTQLNQTGSNVLALSQDGTPSSTLSGVSLLEGGDIQGEYSDGHVQVLGRIAVASFPNYGGLVQVGNNTYQLGASSGAANVGSAGSGGRGQVRSRRLEMSNVDLTASFVEMMTAQRGFQASTRVISAANRLLDDVMQLNIS